MIDLKFAINLNPDGTGGVDPAKMPRQMVNGVCTPVLPHNMIRLNTVFEVVRSTLGPTAYSEKRPSYEFLNGPSGTGVTDLYTPEINCQPHYTLPPPAPPIVLALELGSSVSVPDDTALTRRNGAPLEQAALAQSKSK